MPLSFGIITNLLTGIVEKLKSRNGKCASKLGTLERMTKNSHQELTFHYLKRMKYQGSLLPTAHNVEKSIIRNFLLRLLTGVPAVKFFINQLRNKNE